MIGQKRVPSREGGVEIVVEELAVRMAALGHQVDCYNRWDLPAKGAAKPLKEYKGVRLIQIPTFRHQTLNAFVYSVLATIRAVFGGYDVIHFHAEGPCAMTFLPKLLGIPVVSTIHGLDWQRAKWGGFATRYLLLGERNAAKYSDALLVLSLGNQRYFKDTYGREAIYVPNGVNILPYRPPQQIVSRWGLSRESYILFLARIVPEKGLHYLIEAYKKINTDKRLVIAGKINRDSEYVRKICQMAEEDPRILMTDFVTGQVLEELFSNCFLYVLPSDIEGMAISLLEALSYGVRCLVSDISENVEASKEYARHFQRGNIEILRDRIEQALNDTDEHDRIRQIDFVSRRYSWDVVTRETLQIYDSVICSRKERGNGR